MRSIPLFRNAALILALAAATACKSKDAPAAAIASASPSMAPEQKAAHEDAVNDSLTGTWVGSNGQTLYLGRRFGAALTPLPGRTPVHSWLFDTDKRELDLSAQDDDPAKTLVYRVASLSARALTLTENGQTITFTRR